jgi:mercuric ion transport protein
MSGRNSAWSISAAVLAAVTASICCVGPLLLLGLGVSGAWIGTLTVLEPVRPFFSILTLGFLGFAFYRVYRRAGAEECPDGGHCARPESRRLTRVTLWVVTLAVLGLLSFPYAAPHLFASVSPEQGTSESTQMILVVENMHCETCPVTVAASLERVPGVVSAQVTMEPPQAVVIYDEKQTDIDGLIDATTNAGYPSSALVRRGIPKDRD